MLCLGECQVGGLRSFSHSWAVRQLPAPSRPDFLVAWVEVGTLRGALDLVTLPGFRIASALGKLLSLRFLPQQRNISELLGDEVTSPQVLGTDWVGCYLIAFSPLEFIVQRGHRPKGTRGGRGPGPSYSDRTHKRPIFCI